MSTTRRLAAILAADVVGCSRLMGARLVRSCSYPGSGGGFSPDFLKSGGRPFSRKVGAKGDPKVSWVSHGAT
jgi:hypothetical protein